MKFFLISDSIDTYTGMRLSGIEGVVVHTKEEVMGELNKAIENKEIAVILITEILMKLCYDEITQLKLNLKQPLIVEIPDRHMTSDVTQTIERYVKEAVGINI